MADARSLFALFWNRPYPILTLAALQWAANTVMSRLTVGEISPMQLGTLRWAIVAAVLLVVHRRGLLAEWPRLAPHKLMLLGLGAVGFSGFTALFFVAAHYTTAANLSIFQGAMPLFVFTLAFFVRGRRIGPFQAIGMAAAMAGVVIVATRADLEVARNLAFNLGDLFVLAASALYAVYTIGLENRPAVSSLTFFTAVSVAAFLTSLPMTAAEMLFAPIVWPTPTGWLLTAIIAVFPSFLAQVFFIRGVELIGPGRAGIFVNLIPVFGATMAVVVLGEPFGWYQGVGLALVMAGIVLAQRR
jgi:drug/metabolite transporter (DMT)-like permease